MIDQLDESLNQTISMGTTLVLYVSVLMLMLTAIKALLSAPSFMVLGRSAQTSDRDERRNCRFALRRITERISDLSADPIECLTHYRFFDIDWDSRVTAFRDRLDAVKVAHGLLEEITELDEEIESAWKAAADPKLANLPAASRRVAKKALAYLREGDVRSTAIGAHLILESGAVELPAPAAAALRSHGQNTEPVWLTAADMARNPDPGLQ